MPNIEGRDLKATPALGTGGEEISDGDGTNLLANVNPTFTWVRLAQRIPVWIKLDADVAEPLLISGRTATVSVDAPASTTDRIS